MSEIDELSKKLEAARDRLAEVEAEHGDLDQLRARKRVLNDRKKHSLLVFTAAIAGGLPYHEAEATEQKFLSELDAQLAAVQISLRSIYAAEHEVRARIFEKRRALKEIRQESHDTPDRDQGLWSRVLG